MQQTEPSDLRLMAAIAAGDEEALGALYDRYSVKVFQVALSRLRDPELAEEVVDDVFLRCWEQARTYKPGAVSARAWLCRIADNRAIDVWRGRLGRQRGREEPLPDSDSSHAAPRSGAGFADEVATRLTVQQALDGLSEAQQEVIRFAYYGGLSQSEIAAITGKPLGTVKTLNRAALESLRRTLLPTLVDSWSAAQGKPSETFHEQGGAP